MNGLDFMAKSIATVMLWAMAGTARWYSHFFLQDAVEPLETAVFGGRIPAEINSWPRWHLAGSLPRADAPAMRFAVRWLVGK